MPLKYNKSYVIKLSFCNLFEFWLVVLDKSLRLDLGKTFFFCLLDKGQKTVKCIEGESSNYNYLTYRCMLRRTQHPISALLLSDQ